MTSDAHRGLVDAIGATLPGASWQRRRTHYAANLMSATPWASLGSVKALLHSVYDQPDAEAVHAQFDRVVDALTDKLPQVAAHLDDAMSASMHSIANATFSSTWLGATTSRSPSRMLDRWSLGMELEPSRCPISPLAAG